MARPILIKKFDPIRPVYAAKPFVGNGKQYERGEEFAWRALEVPKHRVKRMYDAGYLVHGDEKPKPQTVRQRNMGTTPIYHESPFHATHDKETADEMAKAVDKEIFPRHTGGPWYELSNGEKIKGKEAAIAAEAEL